ncbi:MAG: hypothetical protein CMK07_00855 [Ponticaulis sp.]|nr:hypothetical protein [Ponticaulis sp.]
MRNLDFGIQGWSRFREFNEVDVAARMSKSSLAPEESSSTIFDVTGDGYSGSLSSSSLAADLSTTSTESLDDVSPDSLLFLDVELIACACCNGNWKNHNYAIAGAENGLLLNWVYTEPGTVPYLDQSNVTLITGDNVADDITSTTTLEVGGSVVSTLDVLGDQDFFQIELEGGLFYEFGQYLQVGGPNLVPLIDAYLEVYDSEGELLAIADGGGPNTPSGLDALLTFEAPESGTYYINARAYDELPLNGDTGDFVGDYLLFANEVDPAFAYQPRYDFESPLHSLDWGPTLDGSSRDPDGDDGPRDNGADFMGSANPYGIEGKNVITYYFAPLGEIYLTEDPTNPGLFSTGVALGWQEFEKQAFRDAFDVYEAVTDNVYIEVDNIADAHFKFYSYAGTPGPGASVLGDMAPPGELDEGEGHFNIADQRWTEAGLQPGGSAFNTILHELGHGHGLSHPHDTGGRSSVMRGSDDGSVIGGSVSDFDLSQGVHTVMSYNDGWTTSPFGQPTFDGLLADVPYGDAGTLSPLDIAVLQDKYGVNEDTNTGNDTYELIDVNAPGTFYSAIWDADGIDEITYGGDRDASINLNDATLEYEIGGGGVVSYATGIFGGFTIANGVTIENASTGSGDDSIVGNEVENILRGGAGDDELNGLAGNDTLIGGDGIDTLNGGGRHDKLLGGDGDDLLIGLAGNDMLLGGTGSDLLEGGTGNDDLRGNDGDDELFGGLGDDVLYGNEGADTFHFEGAFGEDKVRDFEAGVDTITFTDTSIESYEDLIENHLTESGNHLLITDGDNEILLQNMTLAELSANDFAFM